MILVVALPNATVGQKAEVGQGLPNILHTDGNPFNNYVSTLWSPNVVVVCYKYTTKAGKSI